MGASRSGFLITKEVDLFLVIHFNLGYKKKKSFEYLAEEDLLKHISYLILSTCIGLLGTWYLT